MKKLRTQADRSIGRLALLTLIAVEMLMSFSFLGYFHIAPISITIAYIPVLLAGALIGPLEAAVVGMVFGLASMWKASASYVMAADQLFSPFYSDNFMGSILLSVGSRMLFGFVTGLLYVAARRLKPGWLWVAVVSFFGRSIHSMMVYGAMALFFPQEGYRPLHAFSGFFKPENLLTNLGVSAIVLIFWWIAHSRTWQRFHRRLEMYQATQAGEQYHRLSLFGVIVLTLLSALAVTVYFVNRIDYVLGVDGIQLSASRYGDVFHLQIQFMFGMIALMMLVILFLILNRRYISCMAEESRQDTLTGAMNRRSFFSACQKTLDSMKEEREAFGYFIMVDLDHFKEINDRYGHPEGDRALKEVVKNLKEVFQENSMIGRMGGDEFALLIYEDMPRERMELMLGYFLERINRISWNGDRLCCSVGALHISAARPLEELYLEADRLLYQAKREGKNRYVIGKEQQTASL